MSDHLQSRNYPEAAHPDADQLNAFVEHTLPEHERLATLAHLAECGDCREIVALSLPAFEDSAAVAAAPVSPSRFAGWKLVPNLAWIAVPALAGLVILTAHLFKVPARSGLDSSPRQVADVRQPAPPPSVPTPFAPTQLVPTQPIPAPAPLPKAAPASIGGPIVAPFTASQRGISGGVAGGTGMAAPSRQDGSEAKGGLLQEARPAAVATAPVAAANSVAKDNATATVNAQVSLMSAAAIGNEPSHPDASLARRKSAYMAVQAPLPSGLGILSLAANLHQRLAIDVQHQLFFSDDDGQHWKPIPSPWHGRAITVATVALPLPVANGMNLVVSARAPAGVSAFAKSGDHAAILSGTITDATGAAIPSATVVATVVANVLANDSRSALTHTAQTDSAGRYTLQLLPALYRIDAQAPGFLTHSQTTSLAPSQQVVANIALAVGQSAETVEVEASPSVQLDTLSRSISGGVAKAKKPAAHQSAENRPPVFYVVTDTGDRWTSLDGQNWKPE